MLVERPTKDCPRLSHPPRVRMQTDTQNAPISLHGDRKPLTLPTPTPSPTEGKGLETERSSDTPISQETEGQGSHQTEE